MKNQFDEITKGLAQPIPRRAALKKFNVGLAVAALAAFGLANKAKAWALPRPGGGNNGCNTDADCPKSKPYCRFDFTTQRGYCTRQFGSGGPL